MTGRPYHFHSPGGGMMIDENTGSSIPTLPFRIGKTKRKRRK